MSLTVSPNDSINELSVSSTGATVNMTAVGNAVIQTLEIKGGGAQGPPGNDVVWTSISQAAYDALNPPNSSTLYLITS